jgi:SAM-dependent methyltransferase
MLDELLNKIDRFTAQARPWVPFTILNTVRRSLAGPAMSILDIGCGKAEPMRFLNRRKEFRVVGVDIFEPYLQICRESGLYDDLVRADIRQLPFKPRSFDIVLCLEALEHLEKEEGGALLRAMEEIARKQVLFSTPVGKFRQVPYDRNPNQAHKYIWAPVDIKKFGYKVRGAGIRGFGGKSGPQSPFPKMLRLGVILIWILVSPLTYVFPGLAGGMVGSKNLP